MKILNAWMITISLLQLHVCYGSGAGDEKSEICERLIRGSENYINISEMLKETLYPLIKDCNNRIAEKQQIIDRMSTQVESMEAAFYLIINQQSAELRTISAKVESMEAAFGPIINQQSAELQGLQSEVPKLNAQLKQLQKDNEFLSWSDTLALNARHIWAAATTASAVACAGTSYLLSKADTKSSPVLAAAAGGTGLFTLAGIFMTGKKHYVYNQAFKQTDIQKIQTPADQRKLLENIKALDGETSIASWMFYPSQQNNKNE